MNNSKSPLANLMKIMEIMMNDVKKGGEVPEDHSSAVDRLIHEGFDQSDIEAAMKWLSLMAADCPDTMEASAPIISRSTDSIYHLHEMEAIRLSPEAQKLLLSMIEVRSVTVFQVNRTIQYIWRNDLRHVSADRLELLLLMHEATPTPEGIASLSERMPRPYRFN